MSSRHGRNRTAHCLLTPEVAANPLVRKVAPEFRARSVRTPDAIAAAPPPRSGTTRRPRRGTRCPRPCPFPRAARRPSAAPTRSLSCLPDQAPVDQRPPRSAEAPPHGAVPAPPPGCGRPRAEARDRPETHTRSRPSRQTTAPTAGYRRHSEGCQVSQLHSSSGRGAEVVTLPSVRWSPGFSPARRSGEEPGDGKGLRAGLAQRGALALQVGQAAREREADDVGARDAAAGDSGDLGQALDVVDERVGAIQELVRELDRLRGTHERLRVAREEHLGGHVRGVTPGMLRSRGLHGGCPVVRGL